MWTDTRVDLAKQCFADGMSASEAAAVIGGISRNAVIGKWNRLGLTRNRRLKPKANNSLGRRKLIKVGARLWSRSKETPRERAVAQLAVALEATELKPEASLYAVSFMEVAPGQCRWPLGDPRDLANFRFCGCPCADSYCGHHARMAGGGFSS